MRDLRIVFMGTPEFAVGILDTLVQDGRNIVGVITAPDKPAGRGRKLRPSAIKEYASANNLNILQPTNLKDEAFLTELRALDANLQIVVAFRMLPEVVWGMPAYGTFNLHGSLLPHYRGAAPINWAIINGEKKTGVTTFFIDEKIDTGAIIEKESLSISENETAGELHDRLKVLGAKLVSKTVKLIEEDKANPIEQPKETNLKGAPKLRAENTRINWSQSGKEIDRLVRGLYPYPTAWTILFNNGEELKMKVYAVQERKSLHNEAIGALFANKQRIKIAVSDGYIYIKELQIPGKRKMMVTDFLNGYNFSEDAKVM